MTKLYKEGCIFNMYFVIKFGISKALSISTNVKINSCAACCWQKVSDKCTLFNRQHFYKGLGAVEIQNKSSHMHALPSWLNLSSALRRSSSPPSLLPGKDSKEDKRVPFPFLISISPCGENMQVRGVSRAFQASQLGGYCNGSEMTVRPPSKEHTTSTWWATWHSWPCDSFMSLPGYSKKWWPHTAKNTTWRYIPRLSHLI